MNINDLRQLKSNFQNVNLRNRKLSWDPRLLFQRVQLRVFFPGFPGCRAEDLWISWETVYWGFPSSIVSEFRFHVGGLLEIFTACLYIFGAHLSLRVVAKNVAVAQQHLLPRAQQWSSSSSSPLPSSSSSSLSSVGRISATVHVALDVSEQFEMSQCFDPSARATQRCYHLPMLLRTGVTIYPCYYPSVSPSTHVTTHRCQHLPLLLPTGVTIHPCYYPPTEVPVKQSSHSEFIHLLRARGNPFQHERLKNRPIDLSEVLYQVSNQWLLDLRDSTF